MVCRFKNGLECKLRLTALGVLLKMDWRFRFGRLDR